MSKTIEPDFTIEDLMKVLNISKNTAAGITTGRYKVGRLVRYRREDIMQMRNLGRNIPVER